MLYYFRIKILGNKVVCQVAEANRGRKAHRQDQLDRMLEQWRHARPEIDAEGMALIPRVIRLAHLYNTQMARVSRVFGLKPGWLDVLSALRRIGSPHQMSATELARWVLLSSGGMTNRLDRMEEAGLVRRRPDPSDRRSVLVELTPQGREVIDGAIDAHLALYKQLLDGTLSKAEQRKFIELLRVQTLALEDQDQVRAAPQ
jgi:DNA-binding MarR family transcriptional regulator